MQRFLSLLVIPLAFVTASAQTPSGLTTLARPSTKAGGGNASPFMAILAPNNPWILAGEVGIRSLAGDGAFNEKWMFGSAKLMNEIPLGTPATGLHIAAMANLGGAPSGTGTEDEEAKADAAIQALASSSDGINIGVHPYWPVKADGALRVTFFGGAGVKLNSLTDTTNNTSKSLTSLRLHGGLEFSLGLPAEGAMPLTVSAALVTSRFNREQYKAVFGEEKSSLRSAEFTMIVPLKKGLGALAEIVSVPHKTPSVKIGLLVLALGSGGAPAPEPVPSTAADSYKVEMLAGAGLTERSTVTFPSLGVTADTDPCVVSGSDTCVLRVKKGATGAISLQDGFQFNGEGLNGAQTFDAGSITKPMTLKVTKK